MDIELLLFLFFFPCFLIVIFIFSPDGILDLFLYIKYKKAKKDWHYITSTKLGMYIGRWIFMLIMIFILLSISFYLLININHPDTKMVILSVVFMSIFTIFDVFNPTSGNVEFYKEGVIVYFEIFNFLKPFLNYYLPLPWKFFKGYKVKSKNKRKYIILIPKSKLFFNIYIIDNDNVEEIIKNYLNPIQ
ncbi:conserved membrane protein of unknown function [Methanocaldococcus lauensis]|uniref:DUF5673 domain-containing protein n=1 Tax=Methanocaldococcus lauensis TaxID=2546128 RepID=A0A8D6PSY4_9EURY|nr:hypothetical protein [Methanocaldococcus lauensis]CAB3287937.1 conserved membrane protein of unknown function [Methanocaldococcus lauensis]